MFELTPSSGFRPPEKLRKEMDDLFSRFARSDWPSPGGKDADAFVPAMDVKETETAIEVEIEVAGLKPEEIEVSLSGDMLTVKGEKKRSGARRARRAIASSSAGSAPSSAASGCRRRWSATRSKPPRRMACCG